MRERGNGLRALFRKRWTGQAQPPANRLDPALYPSAHMTSSARMTNYAVILKASDKHAWRISTLKSPQTLTKPLAYCRGIKVEPQVASHEIPGRQVQPLSNRPLFQSPRSLRPRFPNGLRL